MRVMKSHNSLATPCLRTHQPALAMRHGFVMVPLDGVSVRRRASVRFIVLRRYADRPGMASRWARSECVGTARHRSILEYPHKWSSRLVLTSRLVPPNRDDPRVHLSLEHDDYAEFAQLGGESAEEF
jgi:hypothetical protein